MRAAFVPHDSPAAGRKSQRMFEAESLTASRGGALQKHEVQPLRCDSKTVRSRTSATLRAQVRCARVRRSGSPKRASAVALVARQSLPIPQLSASSSTCRASASFTMTATSSTSRIRPERHVNPRMRGEDEGVMLGRQREDALDVERGRHGSREELLGSRRAEPAGPVGPTVKLDLQRADPASAAADCGACWRKDPRPAVRPGAPRADRQPPHNRLR